MQARLRITVVARLQSHRPTVHEQPAPGGLGGPVTRQLPPPTPPGLLSSRSSRKELGMHRIRHYLAGLTRCTGAQPAYGGAVAVTLAIALPDPPWFPHILMPPRAHLHRMASGGMPGWQIVLLTISAVLAAALAVALYLIRAMRQRVTAA